MHQNSDENLQADIVSEQSLQVTKSLQAFSGPLPHPDLLREYENILPGCAERILVMAELEQTKRHEITERESKGLLDHLARGQHYAFAAVIITFASAIYLAMNGHEFIASTIVTLDIIGLVVAFITGKALSLKQTKHNES
uniref:DUF2335 domain-containing protein n=1 Tax=Chlorobium chlorochromatii (strain CaD3) TaxID=340177 RepID=Q3ASH4_CHLCH